MGLQTRRTTAEALKLEAEARKLRAEVDKLATEQRKSELEAEALHRWRWFAIPAGFSTLIAVIGGFVGALIARH